MKDGHHDPHNTKYYSLYSLSCGLENKQEHYIELCKMEGKNLSKFEFHIFWVMTSIFAAKVSNNSLSLSYLYIIYNLSGLYDILMIINMDRIERYRVASNCKLVSRCWIGRNLSQRPKLPS